LSFTADFACDDGSAALYDAAYDAAASGCASIARTRGFRIWTTDENGYYRGERWGETSTGGKAFIIPRENAEAVYLVDAQYLKDREKESEWTIDNYENVPDFNLPITVWNNARMKVKAQIGFECDFDPNNYVWGAEEWILNVGANTLRDPAVGAYLTMVPC